MSDQASVWVISTGSYSDYRVLAALSSKKEAERLAKRYSADGDTYSEAIVESLPLVSADIQRVEVLSMTVNIWDDGSQTRENSHYRVEWPFDTLFGTPDVSWRWVRAPMHQGRGGRLDVYGVDHERVRKVFSDQRALLLTDDAYRARKEIRS